MGLFGGSKPKKPEIVTDPVDPGWYRTKRGKFPSLLSLDPDEAGLGGVGGVFLIWHAGLRPEWVYVGHGPDLAKELYAIGNNKEVTNFENMGGLFVTWAFVVEGYRPGVVRFLQENLPTVIETANTYPDDTAPVPVFSPGREPKRKSLLKSEDKAGPDKPKDEAPES